MGTSSLLVFSTHQLEYENKSWLKYQQNQENKQIRNSSWQARARTSPIYPSTLLCNIEKE